ncbi:Hypothetical protein A7982_04132 [Minicystis rosea]|nr:Hypothetical protein A7982_04132 [Minicystis rosea]
MIRRFSQRALLLVSLALGGACSGSSDTNGDAGPPDAGTVKPTPAPEGKPWDTLAEWHLFTDDHEQTPAEGVIPYDVVAPLFSDYTEKHRFLYVPPGKKIGYRDTDRWELPVGAILVKTFAYPIDERDAKKGLRLLETRLLVRESTGWIPHTYEWDAEQKGAVREVAGDTIDVSWIDATGATRTNHYSVPNTNVCLECHGKVGMTGSLGGRTRQWNRDHDYGKGPENQIDHLASLGLLDTTPPAVAARQTLVDPFGSASPSDRGRSYLDANCSHCHGVVGLAKGTAFWLDWDHTDPVKGDPSDYGVCKVPASAGGATCGLAFDVVPGHSELSIVPCRAGTLESKIAMPPVGHNLVHDEGVALLKTWIDAMPEKTCQ